jgi:CHAT domain-containing protein/tetratricopeptide (TPR) repeat protein
LTKIEAETKQGPNRHDSTHAFLLTQIGTLNSKQGDFLKAVQYYWQAIHMIRSNVNSPLVNQDYLVFYYYSLNKFYDSLNRISEMLEAIDSCITIASRRKIVNIYCLAAIYKKIVYLFDVGDYNTCIDYATICEMLGKQYAQGHGNKEYDDGMLFASSSLLWNVNAQLILKNYEQAESLLNRKIEESKKNGLRFDLGTIYNQLAEVQVAKRNFKKALSYYHEAFDAARKEGEDVSCRAILNNIGILYLKHNKNADQAFLYFKKALVLVNNDKLKVENNSVETLNILANIGDVFVQKGIYDSALIYFQLAFDQIRQGITETELLYSRFDEFAGQKKIGYLTSLLLDKGDALQQLYQSTRKLDAIKEAVRIYKVTDQLLDRIKTEQSDMQSKLFWRNDSRRLYEHAIEACYAYENLDDAFYFFEKSRAVLLNDQLNEQRWMGEEDILKQAQIKRKILQLKIKLDELAKDSGQFRELQNELFNSRQELNRLINMIKDRDPLYYQSYIDMKVVTIQDVQKTLLSNHQGLVEIFSGDSAVYVFIVRDGETDFRKLSKNTFDSLSRAYIYLISNPGILNNRFRDFIRLSSQLYNVIFRNTKLPKGRIFISPDGQYFPFEALVINNQGEPLNYFLNDYAVTYTYSAKYLMNHFVSSTDSSSHIFLGIAPVQFPANMQLMTLQGSDRSLSKVQSYFKESSNLVFGQATRSGFMKQFSKYKVIQLYTHAADSGRNGEPVLYFSDSALYLSELVGEDKPVTRLIVLSACETGRGKLYNGEGVFNFNRGFAALGIPSSITNLWSVDDRSTYLLTELFYKYLAKEMPIDIALQKAKIEFIKTASKESRLPYFWAASILVGNNNSLELRRPISWETKTTFIVFLALILLLICLVVIAIRKTFLSNKNIFTHFSDTTGSSKELK